ncbi:MAG: transcription termination/antitermination factor NusG [Chloroflexi bacterium]|nr:transcription termination/antitermination factor NusG [Chloroflexota bacterium]MCK4581094.1 transcription termination/antitermination factor NusG [Dehalococcoidia bacterium]
MMVDGRWYLLYVSSGHEDRAQRNLKHRIKYMDAGDKIFEVIVPTTNEIEVKGGKRRTVGRKAFPGYIMVRMKLDEYSWDTVRNTPGVAGFVSTGVKPVPLAEEEADTILNRMKEAPTEVSVAFKKGDSVRVSSGPFIDFIGKVEEVNPDKGKATVSLSLFGRETPVELDFLTVEKI